MCTHSLLFLCTGSHPLAKYVASFDSRFNSIFMDTAWRELFCRTERPASGRMHGSDGATKKGCVSNVQPTWKGMKWNGVRGWVRGWWMGRRGFPPIARDGYSLLQCSKWSSIMAQLLLPVNCLLKEPSRLSELWLRYSPQRLSKLQS